MRNLLVLLLLFCFLTCSLTPILSAQEDAKPAETNSKASGRVEAAGTVLDEIQGAPDKGIPEEVLGSAECVAVVPSLLNAGFVFDGRLAEDFKMSTGTWVNVGVLRARLILHLAPCVRDAVITGHDRGELGILGVPDVEAFRALCPDLAAAADVRTVLAHPAVRAWVADRLASFASESAGSSTLVARAMLLEDPPSLDALEVTDKGSLNQRAILERRAALVDELYADAPSARVITVPLC